MMHPGENAVERRPVPKDLGREISDDIDHSLERRSAPAGTWRAHAEDAAKRGGSRVWRAFKKRPSLGVVLFGGLAIAAADAVGVGELALGIGIGYAAWQVLRKGKPISEALQEAERLEKL